MFCQKCGKQIEEGSQFCPYCGAKNTAEPEVMKQDVPVKKEKVRRNRKRMPVIIIAVLVLMILGGVMFSEGDESADTSPNNTEGMKDLAMYADYTEEELVQELGYKKNEFGMYPEETHINFLFTDGKIYMIRIDRPEDTGMSLWGVDLKNSIEEADTVLASKGFSCEGSFESAELSKDGSLETVEVTVISYIESATGYPYYISTDEDGKIISLSYTMEAEEPVYAEEIFEPEEESRDFATGPLTYGAYSFDDGTGTTGTAEVGFYTDMDGDYINIECWRNDREIVYFTGILETAGESYYAYCEEINTGIIVTFVDDGLYVQIDESTFTGIDDMAGFYSLDSILNLNEVG
jgi:hypothetical protein